MNDRKIRLMINHIQGNLFEDSPDIDLLIELKDEFDEIYSSNRGEKSFSEASMIANVHVVKKILNLDIH